VRDLPCGDARIFLELEVRRVKCRKCSKVVQEELEWIADNPFSTKRFAFHVGRQCRNATIKEVAKEHKPHWHTVKELEKQYMRRQLEVAGPPMPRAIGIDEGCNNKIRVIQRRAYGLRDEEYLRLKILTAMLPELEI
jgi:transposase